jgi:integrase
MKYKKVGYNRWSYDIHLRGATERPRGVFEGTQYELIAFIEKEKQRIRKNGSLTLRTVGDVLQAYLKEKFQFTRKYNTSKAPFQRLVDTFGNITLSKFKAAHFLAFINQVSEEEYVPGKKRRPDTINLYIMIMKAAFNWACNFHDLPESPIRKVKFLEPKNRQFWVYSPENVDAMLSEAKGGPYYPFLLAYKYLPCRPSELLTLDGANLHEHYFSILADRDKIEEGRTLPIPSELKEYLSVIPKTCPHVFCTASKDGLSRKPLDSRNIKRWIRARKKRLGLPGTTLYGFRRTGAVRMDEAGISLSRIMEFTGHKDPRTLLSRYLPVSQRHKEETMRTLEESFLKNSDEIKKRGQNVDKAA